MVLYEVLYDVLHEGTTWSAIWGSTLSATWSITWEYYIRDAKMYEHANNVCVKCFLDWVTF